MKAFLSVKGFERFQHYKDRSPPWIKLYNELLDDYAFAHLPDASKFHLVAIWLLASRYNNQIPADEKWIGQRINATTPVHLRLLIENGFLIANQACSETLAVRKQNACLETERETEGEGEQRGAPIRSTVLQSPTDEHRLAAKARGVDCDAEWQRYVDWLAANGKVHRDRAAGFRNWLGRATPPVLRAVGAKSQSDRRAEVNAAIWGVRNEPEPTDITGQSERVA